MLEEKLKIELTNVFEIDIIWLSKMRKYMKNGTCNEKEDLKRWIQFWINPLELEEAKMNDKRYE